MGQKKSSPEITVRELTHKEEWLDMYALIKQLNKDMNKKQFEALLIEMLAAGYRCIGAYRKKKLVGVMGFWVGYRFWCGKYIDIDNVIVDKKLRSQGVGRQMIRWVEKEGKRLRCEIAVLD